MAVKPAVQISLNIVVVILWFLYEISQLIVTSNGNFPFLHLCFPLMFLLTWFLDFFPENYFYFILIFVICTPFLSQVSCFPIVNARIAFTCPFFQHTIPAHEFKIGNVDSSIWEKLILLIISRLFLAELLKKF